jgi:hypothetical protein
MGTVVSGAADFYNGRLARSERTEHFVDSFLRKDDNAKATRDYLKRKVIQVQKQNEPRQYRPIHKKHKK